MKWYTAGLSAERAVAPELAGRFAVSCRVASIRLEALGVVRPSDIGQPC